MVLPEVRTEAPAPAVGVAPLRDNRYRTVQVVLFAIGAVLLPAGLVMIGIGWYGAAHTPYLYDQVAYLISGGLLGLGLTFAGGFLYFGAWLATVAASQRESARQMSEAVAMLAAALSRMPAGTTSAASAAGAAGSEERPALVVAGMGNTVHRGDCALIAHRGDLKPIDGAGSDFTVCRVCRPFG